MSYKPAPPLKLNARSPWGKVQEWGYLGHQNQVIQVSTSGHGGVKVPAHLNRLIPPGYRKRGGWYEKDVEWCIPACFLPDDIADAAWPDRGHARRVLRRYFWEAYEDLTGETLVPGESDAKDRDVFAKQLFEGGRALYSNLSVWLEDGTHYVLSYSELVGTPTAERKIHLFSYDEYQTFPYVIGYRKIPMDAPTIDETIKDWPDVPTFPKRVGSDVGQTPQEYLAYLEYSAPSP
jgi:hypothetical protein